MKVWGFLKKSRQSALNSALKYSPAEAVAAVRTILSAEYEWNLRLGGTGEPERTPVEDVEKLLRIGWAISLLDPGLLEAIEVEIDNRVMLSRIQPALKPDEFADLRQKEK